MALLSIFFLYKETVAHSDFLLYFAVDNSKVPPSSHVGAREEKVERWVGWIGLPQT